MARVSNLNKIVRAVEIPLPTNAVHGRRAVAIQGCEETASCTQVSKQSWGQYSPYFAAPSEIDPAIPSGCKVTFAQVLSRHGSRNPTSKKADEYIGMIQDIQESVSEYGKGFEFLESYAPAFDADELTVSGENELSTAGVEFFNRYSDLARQSEPFIRASGSNRVIVSAANFSQGFYGAQGKVSPGLKDILVIPEGDGFNNTLDPKSCPVFTNGAGKDLAKKKQGEWKKKFMPPLIERLNRKLPGANITDKQIIYLMDLCPFETVRDPEGKPSALCNLYSEDEWKSYDYFESLEKWYAPGPGYDMASTQGVGFVNELIARLTGKPVKDHTTTNTTLNASPITFPLDRKLYADFSHDNAMMTIYAALGLFNATKPLPTDRRVTAKESGGYSAAWAVSFAARMYVEKMTCQGEKEELVRILINNRVAPLQTCQADQFGRCKLSAFIESQSFAQSGGRWDACFV